eukprot:s4170_g6.t1
MRLVLCVSSYGFILCPELGDVFFARRLLPHDEWNWGQKVSFALDFNRRGLPKAVKLAFEEPVVGLNAFNNISKHTNSALERLDVFLGDSPEPWLSRHVATLAYSPCALGPMHAGEWKDSDSTREVGPEQGAALHFCDGVLLSGKFSVVLQVDQRC